MKMAQEPQRASQRSKFHISARKSPPRCNSDDLHGEKPHKSLEEIYSLSIPSPSSGHICIIDENELDSAIIGQMPWPEDVKLFQPYETEQILLPDSASCLAVQAFLKMCHLNYSIEYRVNAEDMSPSGKVPFIKCGACLVSELEPIANFVSNKGITLAGNLDNAQKADMRAYMSLVNTVLGNAEEYITWCDDETYSKVTKPRYSSVHPFPLNHILSYMKRKSVIKRLSAFGWSDKTLDKVYEDVDKGCSALSERLEKARFFFGDRPCEVDAALFAHIYSILTWPSYPAGLQMADLIRKYNHLVNHCKSLMHIMNLTDDIDRPTFHPLYLNSLIKSEPQTAPEDIFDEFVYTDCEKKNSGDAQSQEFYSYLNEENPIYESVFNKKC